MCSCARLAWGGIWLADSSRAASGGTSGFVRGKNALEQSAGGKDMSSQFYGCWTHMGVLRVCSVEPVVKKFCLFVFSQFYVDNSFRVSSVNNCLNLHISTLPTELF